jgi:hypothetical protein
MSGTLSATTASALAPILQGLNIGSTGYNLYNQYQNQKYQDTLRSDAQNPAKVTALAQEYTQPLTAGLTAAVNNQTQAQLAQAGLSESPQIAQTVEAQAIAPYIQQNQQQGYQDAIQALQLGGGAIPPGQQQANGISALAKAFAALPGAKGMSLPQLLQLANPGSNGPQPTTPTATDPSIPYQPTQNFDLSSFYTPDYSSTGAGSGYDPTADYAGG